MTRRPAPEVVLRVLLSMNGFHVRMATHFSSLRLFIGAGFTRDNVQRARALAFFAAARSVGFRKPKDGRQEDTGVTLVTGREALRAVGREFSEDRVYLQAFSVPAWVDVDVGLPTVDDDTSPMASEDGLSLDGRDVVGDDWRGDLVVEDQQGGGRVSSPGGGERRGAGGGDGQEEDWYDRNGAANDGEEDEMEEGAVAAEDEHEEEEVYVRVG